MRFELFLASKTGVQSGRAFSSGIVRIAILAIAICLLVLLTTRAIINGFQEKIPAKITGLWGHIQLLPLDLESSVESKPFTLDSALIAQIRHFPEVKTLRCFGNKAGIAKKNAEFEGVVLKGMQSAEAFGQYLRKGHLPDFSESQSSVQILVSQRLASRLSLKIGDKLPVYFVQNPPRVRQFVISGLYSTGLESEFGREVILADLRQIQKLGQWFDNEFGGLEIVLKDIHQIDRVSQQLRRIMPPEVQVESVFNHFPQMFTWLELFDLNEIVLLVILLSVAGINIISALLVLIVERTSTNGLLLALGAKISSIQSVFLLLGSKIIFYGLFWGNLVGLGVYFIQNKYGLIQLDEAVYFVDKVPFKLSVAEVIQFNLGIGLCCFAILFIPALVIRKIRPARAIRYA